MNKIVEVEMVSVRNMDGLIWANTMLEAGWIILSVESFTLLMGADKEVSDNYEELRKKRDTINESLGF